MVTISLYLALSDHDLYDCIRPAMKKRNFWQSGDCIDEFSTSSTAIFLTRTSCAKPKKHDRREAGLFIEEFSCTEMICQFSKTYCCYDSQSNKFIFNSTGSIKERLKTVVISKYRKVFEEILNFTSINRCFRTIQEAVATYEQTKKVLSYFYPHKNCSTR